MKCCMYRFCAKHPPGFPFLTAGCKIYSSARWRLSLRCLEAYTKSPRHTTELWPNIVWTAIGHHMNLFSFVCLFFPSVPHFLNDLVCAERASCRAGPLEFCFCIRTMIGLPRCCCFQRRLIPMRTLNSYGLSGGLYLTNESSMYIYIFFFLEKDKCGFESESCGKQINQEYFF